MELGEISWGRGIHTKEERSLCGGVCTCGDGGRDEEELANTPGRRKQGGRRRTRNVLVQKPSTERDQSGRD